jgi:hypothetical protein
MRIQDNEQNQTLFRIVGVILNSKTKKSEKWKSKRQVEKEFRN